LSHNAPDSEKKKRALFVRFDQAPLANLSFENVQSLTFEQSDNQKLGQINLFHFEVAEPFNIAGEEIGEVRLIVPARK
jgi:hypothetical protein